MPRFSLLLLASLTLHLAAFAAIVAIPRRETCDRSMVKSITVEILDQRLVRENRTEGGAPRRVMRTESKPPGEHTDEPTPRPPPVPAPSEGTPSQGSATIPLPVPAEKGSTVLTVPLGVGTAAEIGPGGGGFRPGAGTARSGGYTEGLPGGGLPSAASGASLKRRDAYLAQVKGLIEAHKEYPVAARRLRKEGSCLRRFVVNRSGALKKVEAPSSCGHEYLDAAATRAITAIGAFPPLPDAFRETDATFTVTITFAVERK